MTQRSEFKHRVAEFKVIAQTWMANRLFSFKQTGLDGFLKRRVLSQPKESTSATGSR